MAVETRPPWLIGFIRAVCGTVIMVMIVLILNISSCISSALERKLYRYLFSTDRKGQLKYTFRGDRYMRRPFIVWRHWKKAMCELRCSVAPGRPAPDSPLVSRRDLTRSVSVLQLTRPGRPLVLVFGSCT